MPLQLSSNPTLEITVYKEDGTVMDLSSMTIKKIILKKPSTSTITADVAFKTDGTDGIVTYKLTGLDEIGSWRGQIYIKLSTSNVWYSNTFHFQVNDNLDVIV